MLAISKLSDKKVFFFNNYVVSTLICDISVSWIEDTCKTSIAFVLQKGIRRPGCGRL